MALPIIILRVHIIEATAGVLITIVDQVTSILLPLVDGEAQRADHHIAHQDPDRRLQHRNDRGNI